MGALSGNALLYLCATLDLTPVSCMHARVQSRCLLKERQSNKGDSHDSQGVIRRCAVCSCKRCVCGYRLSGWLHEMRQRGRDLQFQRHALGGVRQGRHVRLRNSHRARELRGVAVPVDQRGHTPLLLVRSCRFRLFQLHELERRHVHRHDDHGGHQRRADRQRDRGLRRIGGLRAATLFRW